MRTYTELFVDSLTNDEAFIYYLEEGFNTDLLEREEAKAIWHFYRNYYERAKRTGLPDLEILEEEFPKWKFQETNKEAHWILDKLKERWTFRESQKAIQTMSTLTPDEVFPYMTTKVYEVNQVLDTERNLITEDDFDKMMDLYWAKWETGEHYGHTTGFKVIDEEMGGIRKGQLAVLAGRLKSGKTWFGLKAFIEQRHQMINPLFISLELSTEEIWKRYIALVSGVSYNSIDKGMVSPDEWRNIIVPSMTAEKERYGPFRVVQPPFGQRKVSDFVTLADKHKAGSLIIDQLNWIEARKSNRDYYRDDLRMTDIAMELKAAAQRPGREMPVYVMHQLNRQQKKDEAISDVNFADADGILRTADHGFGIRQTDEQREAKVITFEIPASRNSRQGGTFTCDFEFYERTNMANAVRGDTVGEMSVDDAAMIVAKAFDPDPERLAREKLASGSL